jgi:chloramphenicol O-acetyltransferase
MKEIMWYTREEKIKFLLPILEYEDLVKLLVIQSKELEEFNRMIPYTDYQYTDFAKNATERAEKYKQVTMLLSELFPDYI